MKPAPKLPLHERMLAGDPLDLVLMLTLILLIVRPGPDEKWYLAIPLTILAMVPLIYRPLVQSRNFWLLVTGLLLCFHVGYHWHSSDNHKFLITYWCLAITCALSLRNPHAALALNGRLLVGLVFFFATAWKLTSLAYLDNRTFHFLLLTDTRFFPISHLLGNMSWETFRLNQEAISTLRLAPVPSPIQLQGPDQLAPVATFLTWWTVAVEAIIALLFLLPHRSLASGRHIVLLVFVVSTYPPTNVIQFGWILIIMALAGCPRDHFKTRFAYVLAFLFIYCFSTGYLREQFYDWVRTG